MSTDVRHMHRDMLNIKTTANACVDVLSSMMLWAEGERFRDKKTNPCYDVEKYQIPPREHFLQIQAIRRWWRNSTRLRLALTQSRLCG